MKKLNFRKKIVRVFFLAIVLSVSFTATFAQEEEIVWNVVPEPGPAPVPIDGGISLLVAAGAAYGVKKIRDHRKKNHAATPEQDQ